jgi:hypothetical protein
MLFAGHVVINDKFYEASSGNILDEICEWQMLQLPAAACAPAAQHESCWPCSCVVLPVGLHTAFEAAMHLLQAQSWLREVCWVYGASTGPVMQQRRPMQATRCAVRLR